MALHDGSVGMLWQRMLAQPVRSFGVDGFTMQPGHPGPWAILGQQWGTMVSTELTLATATKVAMWQSNMQGVTCGVIHYHSW